IRYVMLSDSELAAEKGVADFYETNWMGMALAYRDYLDNGGYLTRLTAEQVGNDIPLYIETFGALETTQRIMSIPVDVMTPLTTFEDVKTMYDELAAEGVTNVNFKLTGYANGGMFSTVPSKLKWEKSVGGKDGFQALVDYAAEVNAKGDGSNLGIFPDFDFSYISYTDTFDGVNRRQDAVKTIDDRFASYREYSATKQKHESHFQLAISPSKFSKFYEKLTANYLKYDNVNGISVSTLGNTLNSDFDEDDPYNREDSKEFVATALAYLSGLKNNQGQEIELMSEGGNAFTWKFLDHLLDVSLDSSRNNDAAYAVPFIGVVLHGYVNFTGAPLNMEGNISYAMLKAMENGAAPYYILSYQNTQHLKEYELLSHYYSVRYDIWKDDVVELYDELNGVLGDVQDKLIIDHEFWTGTRVPDSDELLDDIKNVLDSFIYDEENANEVLALKDKQAVSIARKQAREAAEAAIASLDDAAVAFKQANDMYAPFLSDVEALAEYKAAYDAVLAVKTEAEYESYAQYANADKESEEGALYQEYLDYRSAKSRYNTTRNRRLNDIVNIYNYYAKAQKALLEVEAHLDNAKAAVELIAATEGMLTDLITEAEAYRDLTDMYLNGSDFTILKDRFKKDANKDSYTVAADVAAMEALVEQYVQSNFEANVEKFDETVAKAEAVFAAAKEAYDAAVAEGNEEKIAEALEKLNAAQTKLDTDLTKAYTDMLAACALQTVTVKAEGEEDVTVDQYAEVEKLSHFVYDYAKLYKTDVNNLAKYYAMVKLSAHSAGYKSTLTEELVKPELDFTQSSFTTDATSAYALFEQVSEIVINGKYITKAEIDKRITPISSSTGDKDEVEEEVFDKYAVEEGSIVIVTYGGKNGVDSDAYKSIILNYNNFSVKVEYQGKVYTLPAYGYVVVMQ
ncbi:MAG: hypothetical protein J6V39_08740, partial [Clostridia bacterium]|nr:hypothetical protein [Clostridia bacterium]